MTLSPDTRARRPRRRSAAAAIAAAVAVTGTLSAAAFATTARPTTVKVTMLAKPKHLALVSSNGRTLYLFLLDRNGKSACYDKCAVLWPPLLTSSKPVAGSGVKASLLGTTRRKDGKLQ